MTDAQKTAQKKWRLKNHKYYLQQQKKWRTKNKELKLKLDQKWRSENKHRFDELQKQWRIKNKEEILAKQRDTRQRAKEKKLKIYWYKLKYERNHPGRAKELYIKNKEKRLIYQNEYNKKHREQVRIQSRKSRKAYVKRNKEKIDEYAKAYRLKKKKSSLDTEYS